jgi:hypothetical protein
MKLASMSTTQLQIWIRRLALELSPVDAFHNACAALRFVYIQFSPLVFHPSDGVLTVVTNEDILNAYSLSHPLYPALVLDTMYCSVDIVGHELGHLIIDRVVPGGLTYQGESGAIHESCADVIGYGTEQYIYEWYRKQSWHVAGGSDWNIGEGILTVPRTMSQLRRIPLSATQLEGWYLGTNNSLFVHTNASVGNYCFYRVCQVLSDVQAFRLWYNVLCSISSNATYRDFGSCLRQHDSSMQIRSIVEDLRLTRTPPQEQPIPKKFYCNVDVIRGHAGSTMSVL